ncbi:MAG: hypothetical protein L0196_06085 [candidate division Zixibacteria bacterium]|nr:hypothetical protein [candidate division Zixibacteria bacterium]
MKRPMQLTIMASVVGLMAFGCQKKGNLTGAPTAPKAGPALGKPALQPPPAPLVTVNFGGSAQEFWPFTGANFSGAPQDPVNLIFVGHSDPRAIRAALLSLDGDRAAFGFPNLSPFNDTWTDAIGDVQTGYGTESGWVGGAVQLACGPYGPVRFHLRLFDIGGWTLGNVHFEVLIPGTTDHQVLNWELAEQLVAADFVRSGLLDPSVPLIQTDAINPSPFREIPAVIYNGLPEDLKALIGGPAGSVENPVPIATDGKATLLNLAGSIEGQPVVAKQDFVIQFDQVIPKPFCASGPFDFIYVKGPVRLSQTVVMSPSGTFTSQFEAQGNLELTPVDPSTSPPTPIGETYQAVVNEQHKSVVTNELTLVSSFQMRTEIPPTGPFRGQLIAELSVGPGESSRYSLEVTCLP